MKNPFHKENNEILIAAAVIGTLAAVAVAYLFLTDDGERRLTGLKHKAKDIAKDFASGVISDKTGIAKKTVKSVADHLVK